MSRPLILGLMTEGSTDVRFLSSIVVRTFEEILLSESKLSIDIYPIEIIDTIAGTFVEKVRYAAEKAEESGVTILCIHTDADDRSDKTAFENKITPAFDEVKSMINSVCKNIVAIVPIQMTESWMLADMQLLKDELMTDKSNQTLQLIRQPENYSDPKEAIRKAINITQTDVPRRKKQYEINISDLYLPIGQKITLTKLNQLVSFRKFFDGAKTILKDLNYLQ